MSLYDYKKSKEIELNDYPFYGIIMGAMRKADDNNLELLKSIFPKIWQELHDRYNSPGGILSHERK